MIFAFGGDENIRHDAYVYLSSNLLSIEWNSIRLGDPAHEIVAKTVAKLCQGW